MADLLLLLARASYAATAAPAGPGTRRVNTAPPPGLSAAVTSPPWASAMRLQTDRPRPSPVGLVLTNGAKMYRPRPAGKPGPSSSTTITTHRHSSPSTADSRART